MNLIITCGNSFERGYQHGKKFKKQIQIEVNKLKNQKIYALKENIEAIKKNLEYITSLDKRLIEEMKGISSGAEVDEKAIIFLNLGFLMSSRGRSLYEWFLNDNLVLEREEMGSGLEI